jgi:GxxExxY protein
MDHKAIQDPNTYTVIGAAMAVHTQLGPGFLEAVYHEALSCELEARGIPHATEVALPVRYRGHLLTTCYRADLICHGDILVELKANRALGPADGMQLVNYLKASGLTRGLLLGFGASSLLYRRYVYTRGKKPPVALD